MLVLSMYDDDENVASRPSVELDRRELCKFGEQGTFLWMNGVACV